MDRITKRINQITKGIAGLLKAEDDNLKDALPKDLGIIEDVVEQVSEAEKKLAKLLRSQQKLYSKKLKGYTAKDEEEMDLSKLLAYILSVHESDPFVGDLKKYLTDFLGKSTGLFTGKFMDLIDKDVAFNQKFSPSALDWFDSWSGELAQLIDDVNIDTIQSSIKRGLIEGKGIDDVAREMEDAYGFSRKRARTIAITETLTCSSVAQHESYLQSPSVTKKKWKHSGPKGITPRKAHVELSGTEVDVAADFLVNGHKAQYPRDVRLPASERVLCHCVLGPVVDEDIFGLSAEEKQEIRNAVLEGREPKLDDVPKKLKTKVNNKVAEAQKPREDNWRSATTHEELNDRFKKTHNYFFEDADDVELDVLKGLGEKVSNVMRTFPELNGYSTRAIIDKSGDYAGDAFAYVLTSRMFGKNPFFVAKYWEGDAFKNEIVDTVESSRKNGFFVSGEGLDEYSLITHEMGHVLANKLNFGKWWEQADLPEQQVEEYVMAEVLKRSKVKEKDLHKELSSYGVVSKEEFFAESFCEFLDSKNPRVVASTFGEVVREVLDKIGGK